MERRLAAILCMDVVGYSRLMAVDEVGTLEREFLDMACCNQQHEKQKLCPLTATARMYSMARGAGLLIVALALTLSGPSHADEWKYQSHEESIISFHSDWYWAAPEKGEFVELQLGDLNPHLYIAAWGIWPARRLQILVERPAPGFRWSSGPPSLDKGYLEERGEFLDAGVSEIEEVPCDARQCVTFKADRIYNCGALLNYASAWDNWTEDGSLVASDIVMAYFCIGRALQVTTGHLDEILASIIIRDDGSGMADKSSTEEAYAASSAPAVVAQDFPENVREAIERAEMLGQAIFEKDVIAAKATDALLASGLSAGDTRLRGWVTLPDGTGWVVYFFGEVADGPLAFYEVRFGDTEWPNPRVRKLVSQPPLAQLGSVMFRARQTALPALTRPCVPSYNSVVLPGKLVEKRGWLVYLLGSTTKPGEAVLTGHMRVHVSADGEKINKAEPLSRSCLISEPPPDGAQIVNFHVSHIIDEWPIETHVFLSLLHDLPVYVSTSLGLWKVEAGSIFFLGQQRP